MHLPVEVQRAEILDWWEAEHERISEALSDRLPSLYYRIDQEIDKMPIKDLVRRGKFRAETIEPIVVAWIEKLHRELTHELDESLRTSLNLLEGDGAGDEWSYSEMAVAGAALAVSAAPAAGIPFFAGGLTAAGTTVLGITFGGGGLLPLSVAALAGSAVFIALGPAARAKAVSHLKLRLRDGVHQGIETRVLGDPKNQAVPSLKGHLLNELYSVAVKRMDMVK